MRTTLALMLATGALIAAAPARAAEYPIEIKTDLKGQYFVVEKAGTENNPTLVVKRVGPYGNHYIKRMFDCKARTVKYLGEGATLEEMAKPLPAQEMTPIVEGSIPDQLARHVCPK